MRVFAERPAITLVGERQHEGSVTLLRAKVEVRATAPGMLVTQ